MPTSTTAGNSVMVHLSRRSSLAESMQEITLMAALNHAIDRVANCFDNCNRRAEPGSVSSKQAEACDENYTEVDNHMTTLAYTNSLAKNFIHSGLDYLKGATAAALDTGSVVHWSSLALTRSLIEASADCLWVVDPVLKLDERLRRTNQMLVRTCNEMLRLLPDSQETTPRLLLVDPVVRTTCKDTRDAALKWADAQGWKCRNGKTISCSRWIGEIPSRTEMVALAGQEDPDIWKDVYRMLSGAIHSQPTLLAMALSDEPDSYYDRALMFLEAGVSFYTQALRVYAEFMGWHDHDIDKWFGPVHATLQNMRFPEETPLPVTNVELERCDVCPDYQSPGMHRLAFASHIYALLERKVHLGNIDGADAPARYSAAVEFLSKYLHVLENGDDLNPKTQEMRTALGRGHIGVLTLMGSDPMDVLTSLAASWAILRSPSYASSVGNIQGWISEPGS